MFIPVPTSRRATPPMGKINIDNFYGADLTNDPSNVSPTRSPECPNMIRTTAGKVGKRPGYATVTTYSAQGDGRINGVHFYQGTTVHKLVHTGVNIYKDSTLLHSDMADTFSVSHQISGKLVIQDGKKMMIYDGSTLVEVTQTGYIPTIIIAGSPTGGGVVLEPRNMVQPKVKYRAAGTVSDTIFQLPDNELDAAIVEVQKLNSGGGFDTLTENTDFSVNRTTGQVTFNTAPGVSPITGEDNLYFTYSKTISGYADKINKTNISILYGLNGARDRIFAAGSEPNVDYYSQINDPTYWGEYWYSVIGQDSANIMGYSIIADKLATHKDDAENDTNVYLRRGTMVGGEVAFLMDGAYQGSGVLAKMSMANLENEPLFVSTDKTINAVTPSDVLGERFSQQRSYYLNGALENESLTDAYACVWSQFYLLAVGDKVYILDGTQFFRERNDPFSHRQYAGFYWTNIGARVMWAEGEDLYFGTSLGEIKKFNAGTQRTDYNDDGVAIPCYWDTVMDSGENFSMKKTYVYVALRLGAYTSTGVKIFGKIKGIWNLLRDYTAEANYFDFGDMDFSDFSFSTDTTPRTIGQKIKIKNVDKTQFRFENSNLNQPFELYESYVEFIQSGYYRK